MRRTCDTCIFSAHLYSIISKLYSPKIIARLNPLQAKWPMELALISSFCSVKQMRVFDYPLDGTLIHRRLAPSRRWYSFTYPGRIESWVSLVTKEDRTNVQISAKQGTELGTLWSEWKDLTNCTNHAHPKLTINSIYFLISSYNYQYSALLICNNSCTTFGCVNAFKPNMDLVGEQNGQKWKTFPYLLMTRPTFQNNSMTSN